MFCKCFLIEEFSFMSSKHSALFVQYFEKLPELDQLDIIKKVIEKFEESLKSEPTAPTAPTKVSTLSIAPDPKPKARKKTGRKPKKTRAKLVRIGKLTILDKPYDSPREVFHKFGLTPGTWYKKIKGKTIKQMERLIELEIDRLNLKKVKPIKKNGVLRRPKLMHSGKDGTVEVK
jgi:hypothetical protein